MTQPLDEEEDGPWEVDADMAPGPDDRDRDLMDGSWEERYYSGREQKRDWRSIQVGILLLLLMSMVIPALLVLAR